jgi:hypothetical protein
MTCTPEPPSTAERLIETELVYQLPEQDDPSQAIELAGAAESRVTVKLVLEDRPAPFWALTSFGSTGSDALALKL